MNLTAALPFESYEVYDDDGKSVGRVVLARNARLFGRTEGTILLQRQPQRVASAAPSSNRLRN